MCNDRQTSGHTELLNCAQKGLYLNFADFDNDLAIKEFCNYNGRQFTLEEMAQVVLLFNTQMTKRTVMCIG